MIEDKPTFCRICEPLCGMIATVDDGRLISLRPDKDHPLSSGFACQKGIAVMHSDDAAQRRIGDGDTVRVRSPYGQIALSVSLTADIVPGTVAVPHGWGHTGTGGWKLANRAGGANVNQLMSSDPADVETLAGMSWLTGVPVEVEPV